MTPSTQSKLLLLLCSRKFWATVLAIATALVAYQTGQVALGQTELTIVGVLSAYVLAVAVEDAGQAAGNASPPTTTIVLPPTPPLPPPAVKSPLVPSGPGVNPSANITSTTGTPAVPTIVTSSQGPGAVIIPITRVQDPINLPFQFRRGELE